MYPYHIVRIAQSIYPEGIPPTVSLEPETKKKAKRGRVASPPPPQAPPIITDQQWQVCHKEYRKKTHDFILEKIVKPMVEQRLARGVPGAEDFAAYTEYAAALISSDRE
jgi:DNA-directed RNA polymerase III subunit RPC1